jgi:hypothetical protein
MIHTHKALHWFAVINGVVIIGGSLILLYLAFVDGGKPIIVYNEPVMTVEPEFNEHGDFVEKKVFYTGEQLTYAFDFCKTRNVPVEMYGSYIDTVKIDMPVVKLKSPTGCSKRISSNYKIPKILPSGMYHFEVELIYQVNPIREVKVKYRTQQFEIINNDLKNI